jgi:hypothetical protein
MKTLILAAMATVMITGTALAGTPLVDKRQGNQAHRIFNGIQNGNLTYGEAGSLIRGHAAVRQKEREYKSDGVVTPAERTKLFLMQTRQDVRIYNKKHN